MQIGYSVGIVRKKGGAGVAAPPAGVYVSPTGNDTTGTGTYAAPYATIKKAHDLANPGAQIWVRGGVYTVTGSTQLITKDGSSGNYIKVFAYPGETPIIDGVGVTAGYSDGAPMQWNSVNWNHWKGITFRNGSVWNFAVDPQGIGSSSNNIVEMCVFQGCRDSTLGEGKGLIWGGDGSNNLLLNNDSFDNANIGAGAYGGADGFQVSWRGAGNILRGNRSWWNSDDGFDLYNTTFSSSLGSTSTMQPTLLDNNWSFRNGFAPDHTSKGGDGTGFKLGGQRADAFNGAHIAQNNIACENYVYGFYENGNDKGIFLYNNATYNNAFRNPRGYGYYTKSTDTLKNNLQVLPVTKGFANDEGLNVVGGTLATNSWTVGGVNAADFVSLDETQLLGARQADGSLPVITFLRLAPGSNLINAGTAIGGLAFNGGAPDLGCFESP